MPKRIKLDFGTLEFYDNFVISEINEGVHFVSEQNKVLISSCLEYFKERPFGYISNRVNSYSVDPFTYMESKDIKNLMAVALVVNTSAQRLSSKIEELFCKRPFLCFYDLESAKTWIQAKATLTTPTPPPFRNERSVIDHP